MCVKGLHHFLHVGDLRIVGREREVDFDLVDVDVWHVFFLARALCVCVGVLVLGGGGGGGMEVKKNVMSARQRFLNGLDI